MLEPASQIFPMGGLHNTLRRIVVDGSPVATGLHAVGDTVCTTNPTLGRGLSLAIQAAADLADGLDQHGEHGTNLALALDEQAGNHIAPFYADQASIDAARLAALRHMIFGAAASTPAAVPGRVTFAQLRSAVRPDGLPGILEGHGDGLPSRRPLYRPRRL